jgi:transposase-like protein
MEGEGDADGMSAEERRRLVARESVGAVAGEHGLDAAALEERRWGERRGMGGGRRGERKDQ